MQRYFFVIHWPDTEHDDKNGTLLQSDSDAREYACRVIRELQAGGGYHDPGLTMVVKGARRKTVFSVPF